MWSADPGPHGDLPVAPGRQERRPLVAERDALQGAAAAARQDARRAGLQVQQPDPPVGAGHGQRLPRRAEGHPVGGQRPGVHRGRGRRRVPGVPQVDRASQDATASPAGPKAAWLQGCRCPRNTAVQTAPSRASHVASVRSAELVSSRSEAGRKHTLLTAAAWRRSVSRQRRRLTSHSRAVRSEEQDASSAPPGWKEQPQVGWPWPRSRRGRSPTHAPAEGRGYGGVTFDLSPAGWTYRGVSAGRCQFGSVGVEAAAGQPIRVTLARQQHLAHLVDQELGQSEGPI